MLETPEVLVDLTGYRALAGYVLALAALQKARTEGLVRLALGTLPDAKWVAERLARQGYAVNVQPRDGGALVDVRNTAGARE